MLPTFHDSSLTRSVAFGKWNMYLGLIAPPSTKHRYYHKTTLRFDGSGFRTNFTLEIVELKKDGLEKVRSNPTKLKYSSSDVWFKFFNRIVEIWTHWKTMNVMWL